MTDSTSRYRAVCKIAECCGRSNDEAGVVQEMLAAAESVLSPDSLELLLNDGGRLTIIRPKAQPSEITGDCVGSILACSKPASIKIQLDGTATNAWVLPLDGLHTGPAALVYKRNGLLKEDKEFLKVVARHILVHLQARDAQSKASPVEKRIEEVTAIYEISQAVHNVPIGDLLKLITKIASLVMDAEACSLMLKDPDKDELEIKASYGLSKKIVEEARAKYGEGVAGRVALTGQPMLINDLQVDPRFTDLRVTPRPDIASSICVPLRDEEGRTQGVLSVRRRSPAAPFDEKSVKLFSVFASQAALAISNAHLYGSLNSRVQELSTLYQASRDLSEAYTREGAAQALVRVAVGMVGEVSAILCLLDKRHKVRVEAALGVPSQLQNLVEKLVDDKVIAWGRTLREPLCLYADKPSRWPSAVKPVGEVLKKVFACVTLFPLIAEDEVIGMLILGCKDPIKPEEGTMRLLSISASQAAIIIKNASRHEQQMEQQALELTALYQLSEKISTAGNLQEALDSILDIVRDIVWYEEAFIATADYERKVMTVQACRGVTDGPVQQTEFALSEDSLMSWAIKERKALVSPDISKDPRFGQPSVRNPKVRSLMAIPLIVHDEVVGVLNVHGYAAKLYTEENVRVLSVIASQAAALYKELEALSALASYTDNILRSIAAGVITLDRESAVLSWNKAAEDITNIPADDAVGKRFSEMVDKFGVPQDEKENILTAINRVVETGEKYLGYKQQYRPFDKEPLCININISQLRNHSGDMLGLVVIFEDVTKEVRMEDEMRRISELAAVGQLAASIAHELRNPLSSIKGAAQYLRKEYGDHVSVCEFLDIIIEEVNILNRITTEFLDFARPIRLNLKEIDVNDVIFRTVQFMHLAITRNNVDVEQRLAFAMPRIVADDKQLEQVFRNMILNALQAMPDDGKLIIGSQPVPDGVEVTVQDTGIGISEEALSQIFVPFFTTKTKGTGLGLSIVQKIIENHGGRVSVKSKLGQGTMFEIFLPICSDRARTAIIEAEGIAERGEDGVMRRGRPLS